MTAETIVNTPSSEQTTDNPKKFIRHIVKQDGLFLTDHVLIALATLTMSFLSLSVPIMTLQVYDRILSNPDGGTLPILLGGVIVALLIEGLIRIGRSYLVANANAIFEHKMNCKVFFHTIHSDFSKIPNFDPGIHLQKLASVNGIKDDFTGGNFVAACETFLLPVFFILLIYIAGWLTLVPLVIVSLYIALALSISFKLKDAIEIRDEHDEKRYSFLVNTLSGIHSIKAFANEKLFERKYEKLKEDMGMAQYRVAILNSSIANLGSIFSGIMTFAVVSCGAYLVINGSLTTGSLIATIVINGRILQPIQKIVQSYIKKRESIHSYKELADLLSMPTDRPTNDLYNDMATGGSLKSEPEGRLEVKAMSFRYAGEDNYLFHNLDLKLNPGTMIGVKGDFGAGKSTLMKLFCGVYPPEKGEILVDGYPVNQYAQKELPMHVGLVESRGVLFRGTIRDNITRFGLTPDDQAQEAAAMLDLNSEIIKLPSGFDTMLSGKAGDSVQPDLRQRIAIARTLATRPKLILFDEPNLDLDFESYNVLFRLLARLKGNVTIVLVSGDRNLNSICDEYYTIQGGTLTKV